MSDENMHYPRKRFGQHFLCDQSVIHRILSLINPKPNEHVVEIGPGQGALTVPVLKQVKSLEVVELDRDLVPALKKRCQHHGDLIVHIADALKFDFAHLKQDERPLRIFGNLPYNISTPLIFHLLEAASQISDMLFMLQKEVAERLTAKANTAHYGRLSVMVQYHYQVELLFNVPNDAFYPMPQVQSSMVRFLPYQQYPYRAKNYALFADIVRHAFGQKRKTLRNSLKDVVSDDVWSTIATHSDLRAENVDIKEFVEISNAVHTLS